MKTTGESSLTAMRFMSMFTLCSSYICSLDSSVQFCTVRLQVRLSVQFTKIHLQMPILSLFRMHNVSPLRAKKEC